jgi:hypothetical protein
MADRDPLDPFSCFVEFSSLTGAETGTSAFDETLNKVLCNLSNSDNSISPVIEALYDILKVELLAGLVSAK